VHYCSVCSQNWCTCSRTALKHWPALQLVCLASPQLLLLILFVCLFVCCCSCCCCCRPTVYDAAVSEPQSHDLRELCLVQQRDTRLAFVPCGHQRLCASCVAQLEQQYAALTSAWSCVCTSGSDMLLKLIMYWGTAFVFFEPPLLWTLDSCDTAIFAFAVFVMTLVFKRIS